MKQQDTIDLLGKILVDGTGRDAVHIAVAPVIAAVRLRPGNHIGWHDREANLVTHAADGRAFGIVDPFMRHVIEPNQRFFAFLFPATISSLRHVWTHPAFPSEPGTPPSKYPNDIVAASTRFLVDFASGIDIDYNTLMQTAVDAIADGQDELWFGYETGHGDIPEEFWVHYSIVTGVDVPEGKWPKRYGCSC